jgi:spore maturation protein CgeB
MFQTLRDSRITLNIESGSTTRHSSNMRLFEATGVGTCLLTDRTEGLGELFEPGREVATYGDLDECVERIRRLLAHPDEREAIARAGQARTLRDHTLAHRARHLDALLRAAAE